MDIVLRTNLILLSLSIKRKNVDENSRGVLARAISTVCVDSLTDWC